MTETFDWDGDWAAIVSADERRSLEQQLQGELCPTHILKGIAATALGRRRFRDDVLFLLADGRFAQVHLTRHDEEDPRWPDTQIHENFDAWKAVPVEDR